MSKTECVCYQSDHWSIELRQRNNHPGLKVWGLYDGHEVFSLDERGLRPRDGNRHTVPKDVEKTAFEEWEKVSH